MNHSHHDINRWTWHYWLDGGGTWDTLWDCTNGDVLLFVLTAVGIIWMVVEYVIYAVHARAAGPMFVDASRQRHMRGLMRVFMFCGCIHVMNLVAWFTTPHLLWALAYYINAAASRNLNRSFPAATERQLHDQEAERRLAEVSEKIDRFVADSTEEKLTLREHAEELRRLCRRT